MGVRANFRSPVVLLADLLFIVIAALGSFALRTDLGPLFKLYLPQAYVLIGVGLVIKPVVYYAFGIYRRLWLYASIQELKLIIIAVTTSSVLVSLVIVLQRSFLISLK